MDLPISFSYPACLLLLLLLGPVVWLWWVGRNPFRRLREGISLGLRLIIVILVVLALSGMQLVRASDELAVVFLLDVSDSVDPAAREEGAAFIRAALDGMEPDDRAAVVLFGADALVERPLSTAKELGELLSVPATSYTDVGAAVRLGLALLPATAQRRLIVLSDGQVNVPGWETAVRMAAASGAEVDAVPLPTRGGEEVWLEGVDVPTSLYEGERFTVIVRVRSASDQRARLRLFADGQLMAEMPIYLRVGRNSFSFAMTAGGPGFSRFGAQVVPEKDVFPQNNKLEAFALVRGAPKVLVVARESHVDEESGKVVDDAGSLVAALESAGLLVERVPPAYLPPALSELGQYAAVILTNVPAHALSNRQMETLQSYVRDLGRGLVCVGGESSYGVGGYFKTPLEDTLPVEMTIKDRERMPPLAIVFVIDKSGSMDIAASPGGPRKIELAKEAVLRSLDLLNPGDQVGVVAFESTAKWVWALAELTDAAAVRQRVMTIRAGGGTDIYAGLSAAVAALEKSDAKLKHVILLTDGGASAVGLRDLALRLRAVNGTLSTVAVGQDAAAFLRLLAMDGGGRYHYTDNPSTIPRIFAQETMLAQRAYIVEEAFYPVLAGHSPMLEGIDRTPALYGYVATTIKPAAQMILATDQGDPLLAQWQYGLGRAVAWTSDATGRWARDWVRWGGFSTFWAQIVRWTIVEQGEAGLDTQITDEGRRAHVVVDVVEDDGRYGDNLAVTVHLISPSQATATMTLRQTAPGRYEGYFVPREEGTYLVRVTAKDRHDPASLPSSQVTGFVRTFSPEYRALGLDRARLRRLVEAGQGRLLTYPREAFVHDQKTVRTFTDIWPWLLMVAVCLLPLDVGVRRVTVDWGKVWQVAKQARTRLRRHPPEVTRSERLVRLMEAKRRAPGAEKRPLEGTASSISESPAPPLEGVSATSRRSPATGQESPSSPGDLSPGATEGASTTARLLAAKKRARRR